MFSRGAHFKIWRDWLTVVQALQRDDNRSENVCDRITIIFRFVVTGISYISWKIIFWRNNSYIYIMHLKYMPVLPVYPNINCDSLSLGCSKSLYESLKNLKLIMTPGHKPRCSHSDGGEFYISGSINRNNQLIMIPIHSCGDTELSVGYKNKHVCVNVATNTKCLRNWHHVQQSRV
jgi:hypothetical protein